MARIAIVVAAVKTHAIDLTLCVGPSMMPTFNPSGDVVAVEKRAARRLRSGDERCARRGDVASTTQLVFKRVVGVGGDVIDVPYSNGRNFRATTTRVRVPVGSVWLQGDNARNSTDSRDYGPVPEDMILGRAIVRVWPPSGFGWVENSMGDARLVRAGADAA